MCSVVASSQRYVLCDDDLASLEPREFVHDSVINFYLDKWSSARRLERRGRYHILSTLCVPYIISHANDTGKIKRNCEKMAKTYGDITQKDWLFFPVNEIRAGKGHHWYLVIFALFPKVQLQTPKQRRCVLVLDSSKSKRSTAHARETVMVLRTWLQNFNRRALTCSTEVPLREVTVHEQGINNCALHVIMNTIFFLEGAGNGGRAGLGDYDDTDAQCLSDLWKVPEDVRVNARTYVTEDCPAASPATVQKKKKTVETVEAVDTVDTVDTVETEAKAKNTKTKKRMAEAKNTKTKKPRKAEATTTNMKRGKANAKAKATWVSMLAVDRLLEALLVKPCISPDILGWTGEHDGLVGETYTLTKSGGTSVTLCEDGYIYAGTSTALVLDGAAARCVLECRSASSG